MDPSIARSAVEPIAAWMPPTLMAVLMVAFALSWWRAVRRQEAARDSRLDMLVAEVAQLNATVNRQTLALQDLVGREQHNELARSLRDGLKATDLDVRELKTRVGILERP